MCTFEYIYVYYLLGVVKIYETASAANNAFVTLSGISFVHVSDNSFISICSAIPTFYSAACMHTFSAFHYVSLCTFLGDL